MLQGSFLAMGFRPCCTATKQVEYESRPSSCNCFVSSKSASRGLESCFLLFLHGCIRLNFFCCIFTFTSNNQGTHGTISIAIIVPLFRHCLHLLRSTRPITVGVKFKSRSTHRLLNPVAKWLILKYDLWLGIWSTLRPWIRFSLQIKNLTSSRVACCPCYAHY